MQWIQCSPGLSKPITAIFAIGIVLLIITVKWDTQSVIAFGQDPVDGLSRIDKLEGWWNSVITAEKTDLFTDLETGYYVVTPLAKFNVSDKRSEHGRKLQKCGFSGQNKLRPMNECVFINQSKRGLEKVMNEKNFNGINCSMKNASFNDNDDHHTALASYPGSGNTWARHLIESMSGINTGSVYNDPSLRKEFHGEGHIKRVIAIKTHRKPGEDKTGFDNVVLLTRSPRGALLAYYNFIKAQSHTKNMNAALLNTIENATTACLNPTICRYTAVTVCQ